MRTDFSLRDLEIFHAIVITGSTRQAAIQLELTQSAVSHALARLEGTLKIRLFTRGKQRLQITAAGLYMFDEAAQFMGNLTRIEENIYALQGNGVASLKIGCAPGLGSRFGPQAVHRYLQDHPGVAISLDVAASSTMIAEVEAGHLDLALVSYEMHEPNLQFRQFVSAKMRVLLLRSSALAKRKEVKLEDLVGEILIRPIQSDHLIFEDKSLRRLHQHELRSSLSSIGAMIELSGGVSLVNAITAADICENTKLTSRGVAVDQWFNFFLVYKHELRTNRLIDDFTKALRLVVNDMQLREDCRGSLKLPEDGENPPVA